MSMGYDQTAVVRSGCIELHSIKLNDFRDKESGLLQLRIRLLEIDLGMIGTSMIRRYHPGEPVLAGHHGIGRNGVDGISRNDGFGGIDIPIITNAEAAMDVMIPSQPTP